MQYMIAIIFNVIEQDGALVQDKGFKVAELEGKKPSLQHLSKTDWTRFRVSA